MKRKKRINKAGRWRFEIEVMFAQQTHSPLHSLPKLLIAHYPNVTLARQTQRTCTANPKSHLHLTQGQVLNDVPKISLLQQTLGHASGANPRCMSKNVIFAENLTCLLQIYQDAFLHSTPECTPESYTTKVTFVVYDTYTCIALTG